MMRSPRLFAAVLAGSIAFLVPERSGCVRSGGARADEPVLLDEGFEARGGALPEGASVAGAPADAVETRDGKLWIRGIDGEGRAREVTVLFGSPDWRDVAVEADIEIVEAVDPRRWAGVIARAGDEGAGAVQLTLRADATRRDGVELAARAGRADRWRVLQVSRAPYAAAGARAPAARRLRLEAAGDWLRGAIDGRIVLQSSRGGLVEERGRVGLRVDGAVVAIERVRVLPMSPPGKEFESALRARPLVVAHRGFSWEAPENTLVAYRRAIEIGAELAECDVQLSADGVAMVIHDDTLARTTGVARKVAELTAAELGKLDAGSWKSPRYAGEPVPTLRQALELVRGKLRFVIEIKASDAEEAVLAAIRQAVVDPIDVMIFAFDYDIVTKIARLESLLPTTWLIDDLPPEESARRDVIRRALRARCSALGLGKDQVDPGFVRLAHGCGLAIFVWTVNDPDDMEHLARSGVDAIITDRPDVLIERLRAPASNR